MAKSIVLQRITHAITGLKTMENEKHIKKDVSTMAVQKLLEAVALLNRDESAL